MKYLVLLLVFVLMPFLAETGDKSTAAFSQQEEMMEEGSAPKKEVKKEEPKTENPLAPKKEEAKKEEVKKEVKQEQIEEDPFKDDSKKSVPEHLKFYKEKYDTTYEEPFEIVWNAIKKSVGDLPCQISVENYKATDEGLYKGLIKSDFCVFTLGEDSTFKVLKKYSYEVPVIRGGIWGNGRMQYTFVVKESAGGNVYVQIKGELSGMENFVTHEVHFWKSNGLFETLMFERITKNVELLHNK